MEDDTKAVILISKDGHSFEFQTNEKNKEKAIEKAFKKIEELGYNIYDYQLKDINTSITQPIKKIIKE
jgi:hypothetical protein